MLCTKDSVKKFEVTKSWLHHSGVLEGVAEENSVYYVFGGGENEIPH